MTMTSTRPYLLRAFHEWIVDNNMTPYVVIDAEYPQVQVPRQYIEDGKIILNVSPYATEGLLMSNERLEFNASFAGQVYTIDAPMGSVLAVYAKENGRGMVFQEDDEPPLPPPAGDNDTDSSGSGSKRPNLRVVK